MLRSLHLTQLMLANRNNLQRNIHSQAPTHSSGWYPRQLRNSLPYTLNVAAYKGKDLNMNWECPVYILSCLSTDPRSPIQDFVIARHHNRLEEDDKFGLISLMLFWKFGVSNQIFSQFDEKHQQAEIIFNHNLGPRIGLTTNCIEEKERIRLEKFIHFVDRIQPLSLEIKQQIAALFQPNIDLIPKIRREDLNPTNIAALPHSFPFEHEASPLYFRNTGASLYFGGDNNVTFHPIYDAKIPEELPTIHQAIVKGDKAQVAVLLSENPTLIHAKDPWGNCAYDIARDLGPVEIFELFHEAASKTLLTTTQAQNHHNHFTMIREWKKTGYNAIINMGAKKNQQSILQKPAQNTQHYLICLFQNEIHCIKHVSIIN